MEVEELLARESIKHTMAKYSMAGDEFEVEDYVSCFTEDGTMEFANFPGQGHLLFNGREEIREFVSGFFGAVKRGDAALPWTFMRHHITTCRIQLIDENSARAKTYILYSSNHGVENSGIYTDEFRKVGDHWLIASRNWTVDE